MTNKNWDPVGNPPDDGGRDDVTRRDDVVELPRTPAVASNDARGSYESLALFLQENAAEGSEIKMLHPDQVFGKPGGRA